MGMELSLEEKEGYLYARVLGRFSLDEANRTALDLFEHLSRCAVGRVLVDCRELEGSVTVLEQFSHAKFFAMNLDESSLRGVDKGTRFAYVVTGAFEDLDRFAETVAVNRSVNVRTFNNYEQALDWISKESVGKVDPVD